MSEIVHRIGLLVPSSDGVTEADSRISCPQRVVPYGAALPQRLDAPRTPRLTRSSARPKPRSARSSRSIPSWSSLPARAPVSTRPGLGTGRCREDSGRRRSSGDRYYDRGHRSIANRGREADLHGHAVSGGDNKIELKFFRDSGIEITAIPFRVRQEQGINKTFCRQQIIERVLSVRQDIQGCDALLISCTGLRGADTVARLEPELGLPVITSNVATVWATVRALGLSTARIPGGRICEPPVTSVDGA